MNETRLSTAISVSNLTLSRGDRKLLSHYALSIPSGSKILLDAPSGRGKTTLLRILVGLEDFDSGEIIVSGIPLEKKNIRTIRRKVAYLSQAVDLPGELTVVQAVELILSYEGNRQASGFDQRQGGLEALLHRWDIPAGFESHPVSSLSGGERQRLALAILELLDRPIWILDEPTAALDEQRGIEAAKRLLEKKQRTILAVSHDPFWRNLPLDDVVKFPEEGDLR